MSPNAERATFVLVGVDDELADACVRAVEGVPVARAKYVNGAVLRVIMNEPVAVVVGASLGEPEFVTIRDIAARTGAEVIRLKHRADELGLPKRLRTCLAKSKP